MDDFKMEDIRQTKEWGEYLQSCGWVVEKIPTVPPRGNAAGATQPPGRNFNVFIRRIPLTPFSMMKIQRFSGELDLNILKELKRKYRIVYTVVEPAVATLTNSTSEEPPPRWGHPSGKSRPRRNSGWKINTKPFLPTKSVVINLKKSEKQLWNDLSVNAKRILRKEDSTSEQIIFRKNDSSDEKSRIGFYEAWKKASKTWLMSEERFNKLLDAFSERASLWVSEDKKELLSGIVLLRSKDTANYFQTWTSKKGRHLGSHYYLVWQVILECKKQGLKWFDFEGVLDKRWPQKKWLGFSEFKKKFGGKVVTYPGSFTKWF